MKNRTLLAIVIASAGLVACSDPPPAPEPVIQPAPAATAAPTVITRENQGILTDTQRDGLNAANQMSEQLKAAEEARRKQMDAQGI